MNVPVAYSNCLPRAWLFLFVAIPESDSVLCEWEKIRDWTKVVCIEGWSVWETVRYRVSTVHTLGLYASRYSRGCFIVTHPDNNTNKTSSQSSILQM